MNAPTPPTTASPTTKRTRRLFASWASADVELAEELWVELKRSLRAISDDHDVWSFTERLLAGDLWDDVIRDAMAESASCVLAVSRSSLPSRYIRDVELEHFRSHRKRIVPVLLEPLPRSADLRLLDGLDVFGWGRPFNELSATERVRFANDLAERVAA